jgi:cardiolipin synthase A/B
MTYLLWTFAIAYVFSLCLIRWVLLLKQREPTSSIAWILLIIVLPVLGGLLFLVFGINRVERKAVGMKRATRRVLGPILPELSRFESAPLNSREPLQNGLLRMATQINLMPATFGNRVEVLSQMPRTLALMEEAIEGAQQTLHLEYYIWKPDRTGTRLRDMLIEKARAGVKVRFLYDGIGSITLSRRFLRPMRDAGILVASFLPGRAFLHRWSVNLRSHRKILVVDGRVGFTGGMNIGDEYLGKDPLLGFWRDTHLRMHGPAVLQLQQVFVEDWLFATNEEIPLAEVFPTPQESGDVVAQVLVGEPIGELSTFHSVLFAAITDARKQILLTASYFVPPESLVTSLETAARQGVRVRLVLSSRCNYFWTLAAGRSYYESLLRAGVEIYEYEQGLMHAKTLTIDGQWSLVGTANFDTRSLFLNFEVGVAVYDQRIATQLEEQFDEDVAHSTRILLDAWLERPESHVLSENIWRLFAPVL